MLGNSFSGSFGVLVEKNSNQGSADRRRNDGGTASERGGEAAYLGKITGRFVVGFILGGRVAEYDALWLAGATATRTGRRICLEAEVKQKQVF